MKKKMVSGLLVAVFGAVFCAALVTGVVGPCGEAYAAEQSDRARQERQRKREQLYNELKRAEANLENAKQNEAKFEAERAKGQHKGVVNPFTNEVARYKREVERARDNLFKFDNQ